MRPMFDFGDAILLGATPGDNFFFFQIKHILIRDTWRDDVSGDQIMSQRIRGHRLTHHNLPFQANTPPQHRQQAHPG